MIIKSLQHHKGHNIIQLDVGTHQQHLILILQLLYPKTALSLQQFSIYQFITINSFNVNIFSYMLGLFIFE
jgi:hypothetical protein